MNEVKLPKIFKPLNEHHRYKVMYGGRGSAKSWTVARKLILRGVQDKLLILCARELQKSIKQSVHRLIKDQITHLGLDSFFTVTDHAIKGINGTEFIFLGTKHNPDEIRSTEGIDICWIEEAHNLTEASWDIIDPTIRKEGSEIWITFNTRFKFDHLYQLFIANTPPPSSWVQKVNYSDNPFFEETALPLQMEHMKTVDYEKYLHIWEGDLKILAEGAIFGKQILRARKEDRLSTIPIAEGVEVHTFWDLGRNDHTAVWFMQDIAGQYRMIDYYENRLQDIAHYCRVAKGQATDEDMLLNGITKEDNNRRANYSFGTHYMPHDVEHVVLGMDKTRIEQFENGGIRPVETVDRVKVKNEGIEAARQVFPNVWIDSKRCEKGIECLSNYRYKYNDDNDTHGQTPHHDWASNGADAFMQFAQGYQVLASWKPLENKQQSIA